MNQSVSFPPQLLAQTKKRAKNLGLPLSTYIQKCVEKDLETRGPIVFDEKASQPPESPGKKA